MWAVWRAFARQKTRAEPGTAVHRGWHSRAGSERRARRPSRFAAYAGAKALEERGPLNDVLHAFLHRAGRDDVKAVPLVEARLRKEGVEILGPVGLEDHHCGVLVVDKRAGDDRDVVLFSDLRDLRANVEQERLGLGV